MDRDDFPHLHPTEFSQLNYYGNIKASNVPKNLYGWCPKCGEDKFIFRQKMRGTGYIGACKDCGIVYRSNKTLNEGVSKGKKYCLEHLKHFDDIEKFESWLSNHVEIYCD